VIVDIFNPQGFFFQAVGLGAHGTAGVGFHLDVSLLMK